MEHRQPSEVWASGAAYEPFIGRWSRLVAGDFLGWLAVPPASRWLDVGCGTGALSETIVRTATPRRVMGVDPSPAFIDFAQRAIPDNRVRFQVGDAQALPVRTAVFDASVAGLVLNFVPDPDRAVAEMVRATRPGGQVGAYVWDYAGGMQLLRRFWDAVVAGDPDAAAQDEGRRFPICQPQALERLFSTANLAEVAVRAIEIDTPFPTFAAYWQPFLGGQGPAPGYVRSLSEEQRAALRERLRARLAGEADGAIRLTARAWAVRGRRR